MVIGMWWVFSSITQSVFSSALLWRCVCRPANGQCHREQEMHERGVVPSEPRPGDKYESENYSSLVLWLLEVITSAIFSIYKQCIDSQGNTIKLSQRAIGFIKQDGLPRTILALVFLKRFCFFSPGNSLIDQFRRLFDTAGELTAVLTWTDATHCH